jgi:hypothetical protein
VTAQMMRDIQAEWEAACDRSKSKKAVNYAASNPTRRLALIAQFMRKAMENRYLAESPMLEEFIKAPRDKHRHRSRQQQPSVADLFAVEDDEVQSVNGEDGEIPSPFFETRMEREAREQRELEEKELEAHLEMERAAETERQENIRIAADKPTRRGQNPFHSLQVKKE